MRTAARLFFILVLGAGAVGRTAHAEDTATRSATADDPVPFAWNGFYAGGALGVGGSRL